MKSSTQPLCRWCGKPLRRPRRDRAPRHRGQGLQRRAAQAAEGTSMIRRQSPRRDRQLARKEAFSILAGCANGATEASLAACGVDREVLDQLVRRGHVRTWMQELHTPRVSVKWYAIIQG